ncbi:dynamin family protein [Azospirillum halopraeferens]|uniref:dynamin family protein n=1 Tax=Azospirillum halopraeferens TaxID=34010 RepID=UPI00040C4620|nr:dynamin family protein [Azospirillum halopraeferens]
MEAHLKTENPNLLPVIPTYREFDRLLQGLGLLKRDESLATRIPWWPMIAILGTFSAGKSTFINSYLRHPLQGTGNQAVDDKFTVICYGADTKHEALPGTALNADPRFPFYRISDEVEKVAAGEGKRIDSYLQLKTLKSDRVRGKIIIDSPGFDADDQRRSVLRLVDHIIDLSDLVLVFFDARHPEPGAMHDTLHLLVSKTVRRADARKFLYILNQIDTTAREDNAEAVFGAWQRSVAQAGLVSGRFYGIYDREAAGPIGNEAQRARYESKAAADLAEIHGRIAEVEIGRGYRIVGMLDSLTKEVEGELVPYVQAAVARWRRAVLMGDAVWAGLLAALAAGVVYLGGVDALPAFGTWLVEEQPAWAAGLPVRLVALGVAVAGIFLAGHFWLRGVMARRIAAGLPERMGEADLNPRNAFLKNTGLFRSVLRKVPVGWGGRARKRVFAIRQAVAAHVQRLNDLYTDPTGRRRPADDAEVAPAAGTPVGT